MTQPVWTFGLYNSAGSLLADLSVASNRTLTSTLNAPTVLSFNIPASHPAAALITPAATYIRAYRRVDSTNTLRFHGPVWMDETSTGQGIDTLQVTAADPMIRLGRRYVTPSYTSTDRGAIIQDLIADANTDAETGIQTTSATIETSSTITTDYEIERPAILDVIQQYADATDGCDTVIDPIEYSSGKIGQLNIYARRGSNQAGAIFAYGAGTLANCLSINRIRNADNLANHVLAVEDTVTTIWQNTTSQTTYGRIETALSLQGDTNVASMTARTRRYLDTHDDINDIATYQIVAGPRAPRLYDDFNIGDTVQVHYRGAQLEYQTTQRVTSCTIAIDDSGRETISQLETQAN